MKFYVATGFENREEADRIAAALKAAGHHEMLDWRKFPADMPLADIAHAERAAVAASDALILRLPGLRGTFTEFGVALGTGTQVFALGTLEDFQTQDREAALPFFHLPQVWRLALPFGGDLSPLVNILRMWDPAANALSSTALECLRDGNFITEEDAHV